MTPRSSCFEQNTAAASAPQRDELRPKGMFGTLAGY